MPSQPDQIARLAVLRSQVQAIEQIRAHARDVLPFGVETIDRRLADGGIVRGAVHEVAGARVDPACEAAALCFVAGIAGRLGGTVLWVLRRRDLFAPGLAQVGLAPDHILYAEADTDADILAVMEEGLRHGAPAAVVGEIFRAGLAATRRLQLAAESTGATALLLRARRPEEAMPFGEPSAAFTRWTLAPMPSSPLSVAGIGRARWHLVLVRQRGGESFDLAVEANDAAGRLALPAGFPDRADQANRSRAAA